MFCRFARDLEPIERLRWSCWARLSKHCTSSSSLARSPNCVLRRPAEFFISLLMVFRFEPLTKAPDRTGFRCGVEPLDVYLQQLARKDAERRAAAAFVMPDAAVPATIVGYYTLSAFAVEIWELPEALHKSYRVAR
jgi:hypothetical protein